MFRFACTLIAVSVFVDVVKPLTTETPDSDRHQTEPYTNYGTGEPFKTTGYYGNTGNYRTNSYGDRWRYTTGYYGTRNTGHYGTNGYGDHFSNTPYPGYYRTTPYDRRNTGSSDDYYRNRRTTGYYRRGYTDSYGNFRTDRYRTRRYGDLFTGRYNTRSPYGTHEAPLSEFTDSETGETKYIFSPQFMAKSAYNAIQSTINYLKSLVSH